MKENIIIGKLIPAGIGMKKYGSIKLDSDAEDIMFSDDYENFDYEDKFADQGEEDEEQGFLQKKE